MIVDTAVYRQGRRSPAPAEVSAALEQARQEPDGFLWIGLHEPSSDEFEEVRTACRLHPLAVEDALSAHQRPKLELYEGSLFLVLKPLRYDDSDGSVTADELMVFVGDSFVVTVRHGTANPLSAVRQRLEREPEVLRHGPSAVLYGISDTVVDHYLDIAEELHVDLDELEEEVFTPGGPSGGRMAERIYAFKRQALAFRRAASPLAEPMTRLADSALPFVPEGTRPFFRDVQDHLTRTNEQVDTLDGLLSDILSAYLAQVSVRQNDDMRKISAWAAMFAVPTLITGVYGMDFAYMPEREVAWAYPAVLVLVVVVCLLLFRFFKRRGWL